MAKSIAEITAIITKFGDDRGWTNEDPNQMLSSIHIELAELAEHFQWKNKFWELTEGEKVEIGYEFVDVVIYLFRMASRAGIDIEKYFDEKLPKLAKKFPVNADKAVWKKSHDDYRRSGKNKRYDD